MSNEGVDLFSEMCRLAADRPDIAPIALLRCATLGGRIALGLDGGATVFSPGSRADAILLGGAPGDVESMTTGDVAAWILSGSARLATTIHAGQVGAVADEAPASLRGFLDTVMERG
jgi:cytosine/adenosine deaminase-related metal-dependent hydrolase